jgi:hypothetical protein
MNRLGRLLRTIVKSLFVCAVGAGLLLVSPAGRVIDQQLTAHFLALNQRRDEQHLGWLDGVEVYLLYHGIVVGGQLISQDGGQVLWHYLHGGGTDLWLNSSRIRTSPVIIRSLASLRESESRRFTFRQSEDVSLSYAINPFHLKRKNGKVLLWQKIQFANDPTTYTVLDYGIGRFRLPDALIHALHPQPFTVYAQWSTSHGQ